MKKIKSKKNKSIQKLELEWLEIKTKWENSPKFARTTKAKPVVPSQVSAKPVVKVPSLNSWVTGAVSSKPSQQYTGDKVIGIAVQHKSCLQPVFSQSEAEESAKMRR